MTIARRRVPRRNLVKNAGISPTMTTARRRPPRTNRMTFSLSFLSLSECRCVHRLVARPVSGLFVGGSADGVSGTERVLFVRGALYFGAGSPYHLQ